MISYNEQINNRSVLDYVKKKTIQCSHCGKKCSAFEDVVCPYCGVELNGK